MALVVIVGRLFYIQVARGQDYRARADAQQSRKFIITAKRGQIYVHDDINGTSSDNASDLYPVALNQTLKFAYADPSFVTDPLATADKIAPLLDLNVDTLEAQLAQKKTRYVVLKEKVSASAAAKISALKLPGIVLEDKDYRYYPESNLFSQELGFVDADGKGQYGIEGYLDSSLAGHDGQLKAITDSLGVPLTGDQNVLVPPQNGKSYVLTLDRTVQHIADVAITQAVQTNKAASGSIVVMDPKTGAIRAMANYPNFDPNNYSAVTDYSVFSNQAVSDAYEPGSVFKAYTISAGIDTGKITPTTQYTDAGVATIDGVQIHNAEDNKFGLQTMTDVIQKSLNTGAIFVLESLGGDTTKVVQAGKTLFARYVQRFGFGVATGVEQADEASGYVPPPSSSDVDYATMSFGQGLRTTEMQLISSMAAIANGGTLYQPYLVDQTIDGDKTIQNQPKIIRQGVISPQSAATVANMLIKVVEGGSGYQARTPGYTIAGKTGTAQVPLSNGQGYDPHKNIGSFVGFAPVQDPKFIILVRVNFPQVPGFAEDTAVPAFASVARQLFQYYQIPPNS